MVSGDQQTRQTKGEETNPASLLSVAQSQFEQKDHHSSKGQTCESQSHHGSGAASHVMLKAMFLLVKLERETSPNNFVAANGEQIRDSGDKNIPFKRHEGIQKCNNGVCTNGLVDLLR